MTAAPSAFRCPGTPPGEILAVSVDALVSGIHFPHDTPPADVAWKSLAVNLSDLAAMGARPLAMQAIFAAPAADAGWAEAVATAAVAAARELAVAVSTRCEPGASRRVAVHAVGSVPRGAALTRSGARPGDELWVSGSLGEAGAGLDLARGRLTGAAADDRKRLLARLARPTPRLALGLALRGIASAAIDLSDGIASDAGHLARRSGVAVQVQAHRLPLAGALRRAAGEIAARELALVAGDDYELLFTAPAAAAGRVRAAGRASGTAVTVVGGVQAGAGLRIVDEAGAELTTAGGFQHFAPGPDRRR